jgi:sacsin
MPQEMRVWAKREVYFPWVAVAAQISPYEADPTGSLSTVLPLPIPSSQPVHIHAAFHLSPDRQRLTRVDKESLSSKDDATKWNDWLLHHCIPSTWAKLTAFAVDQEECPSGFQFWPRQPYAAHDNFYGVTEDFLRIIDTEGLSVWPTEAGYMTASQSLLNVNSISLVLRAAFNQAKVPVVYPPPHLLAHFKPYFDGRYLNAETLCTFLKQNREGVAKLDDQSKIEILQYLFREDVSLGSFYDLELFPFKSGHFGVLEQNSTFIDRDEAEAELFCHETDLILDLEKFSELTASSLRDRCSKMVLAPYIKNRSWEALSSYSLVHQFADLPTDRDIVMLDPEATSFVTKAWTWIIKYEVDVIKSASELWLIPLTNGHHRKIVPHDAHSTIYSVPPNATGKFMKSLQDQNSLDNSLMDVSDMNLGNAALSILLAAASRSPVMHIMDCEHAVAFAHWLRRNASNVLKSSPATKHLIIELIASSLHSSIAQIDRQSIAESVKGLEIFSKLIWSNIGDKWYVLGLPSHNTP